MPIFAKNLAMATLKFLIRQKTEQLQSVYISYRFGRNEKLMYATPLKVESLFWDAEKQKVKVSIYCPYADDINAALFSISSKFDAFIINNVKEGLPVNKQTVKDFFDDYFGKGQKTDSLHKFFEAYIEECDTRSNGRRGGQTVTYKTKREYVRTYELLRGYEKKKGRTYDFSDIDKAFLSSFVSFLQGMNLSTNTIAHKIITLKALMRAAIERELTDNTRWQGFRIATEDTDAVALNEEELERIRRCNLSRHPRLAEVRDLFLIGCWTGLRFSDIIRLRSEYIHGDYIVIQQQKTDKFVTIPLHPVVKEIWERYGGALRVISNQKFNEHIKAVCKAARIRERVLKSITKGGKKITTQHEKWELVSAHTGRRSFATNLYKSGFPSISIMQITGHKTEAAFLRYIKVSREEHARLLAEHWKKFNSKY